MNIKNKKIVWVATTRDLTVALLFFLAALMLGVLVRLIGLGMLPLSDREASLGFQVLNITSAGSSNATSQVLYQNLTGIVFFLFGAGNFTARIIPAIFGGMLVFSPYLFRKQIGTKTAIILAFIIALDPCLLGLSRQADSAIIAMTLLMYGVGFFINSNIIGSGICAGLALLSGPKIWIGLIGFGVALLWFRYSRKLNVKKTEEEALKKIDQKMIIRFFLSMVISFLAIGTLFFLRPTGIAGPVSDFLEFLKLWKINLVIWPWTSLFMLIILAVYELLILVFGLIGIISKSNQDRDAYNILWRTLLVFGILTFLGPLMVPMDPSWIILTLAFFAAAGMSSLLKIPSQNQAPFYVKAFIDIVLIGFAWMNYIWVLNNYGVPQPQITSHIIAIGIAFGILMILLVLYILGWNWETAIRGLCWAIFAILMIFSLSMTRRVMGFGNDPILEPYRVDTQIVDTSRLKETISGLISRNAMTKFDLEISVIGEVGDSIKWFLEEYDMVSYYDELPPDLATPLVITTESIEASLAAIYTGQSFEWYGEPDWLQYTPLDWLKWISLQKAPVVSSEIILWVRTDLFPASP